MSNHRSHGGGALVSAFRHELSALPELGDSIKVAKRRLASRQGAHPMDFFRESPDAPKDVVNQRWVGPLSPTQEAQEARLDTGDLTVIDEWRDGTRFLVYRLPVGKIVAFATGAILLAASAPILLNHHDSQEVNRQEQPSSGNDLLPANNAEAPTPGPERYTPPEPTGLKLVPEDLWQPPQAGN